MRQEPAHRHVIVRRMEHLRTEWVRSIGFFCVVLAFFLGLEFLLDPLFPIVSADSPYHQWGEGGLLVIGLVYVAVSLWDACVSQREGYAVTVTVLCGFGLLSSIHPFNAVGVTFSVLVLVSVFGDRLMRARGRASEGE